MRINHHSLALVENLDKEHDNAVQIFGGAISVQNIDDLVLMLPTVITDAKFWHWHAGLVDACRTFCTLCGYDPALVESYIGTKFEEVCAHA